MRTVLITGANKGIGLETARQLGKAGDRILVCARNTELGQAATAKLRGEGVEARFLALDVSAPGTIAAAAKQIEADYGSLDVLINNAGINEPGDGMPSAAKLDAVRRVLEINFLGALAVTQAMLPLLRKSLAARIVNVSSSLGSLSAMSTRGMQNAKDSHLTGYTASKAALNMLTVMLAAELRDTTIKVNCVNPGYTATDLNGERGSQSVREGAAPSVSLASPEVSTSGGFFNATGSEPW